MGDYTTVSLIVPSTTNTGSVEFNLAGYLTKNAGWSNFAVGLWYDSGPSDYITVTVDSTSHRINKGNGLVFYINNPNVPATITSRGTITLPLEGSYTVVGIAGYIQGGAFYVDSRDSKTISYTASAPSPTPTPTPSPAPTIQPPSDWVTMAVVAGSVAVFAVGVALALKELTSKK
jgi:hypothetical protein